MAEGGELGCVVWGRVSPGLEHIHFVFKGFVRSSGCATEGPALREKERAMKQKLIWVVLAFALVAMTATTGQAELIGRTFYLVGDATLWRDGSPIPFVRGMDLFDEDEIETERFSVAGFLVYNEDGDIGVEVKMFGMPAITGGDAGGGGGGNGCAGAPGGKGKSKLRLKKRKRGKGTTKLVVLDLSKGTSSAR